MKFRPCFLTSLRPGASAGPVAPQLRTCAMGVSSPQRLGVAALPYKAAEAEGGRGRVGGEKSQHPAAGAGRGCPRRRAGGRGAAGEACSLLWASPRFLGAPCRMGRPTGRRADRSPWQRAARAAQMPSAGPPQTLAKPRRRRDPATPPPAGPIRVRGENN